MPRYAANLFSIAICLLLSFNQSFASDDFRWQNHNESMHGSGPHHSGPIMGNFDHMGKHPGEHGKFSNYRDYRPRNAALNFLRMDKMLNLSSEQKEKLRTLRDDWIENQTVPAAQLKVARSDLIHMIYSNTDSKEIDAHLKKIGQLEGGLWRAFVDHYKSIIDILTKKQRKMVLDDSYLK